MRTLELTLLNFRCFASKLIKFDDNNFIYIIGPNGSGKSSLLEAISYACYSKSFRQARKEDMIASGQTSTFCKIALENDTGEQFSLEMGFDSKTKKLKLDGKAFVSHKPIAESFGCIVLEQDCIELVSGSPEKKRLFLDMGMYLHDSTWAQVIASAKKILQSRKKALEMRASTLELKLWTEKLWQITRHITTLRADFLSNLQTKALTIINTHLSDTKFTQGLTLTFLPSTDLGENFEEFWHKWEQTKFPREQFLQNNFFGPHKDSFAIFNHLGNAQNFCSRGQQKMLTLILELAKLSSWKNEQTETKSIILIDDFFTELDESNKMLALHVLAQTNTQVIITGPCHDNEIAKTLNPQVIEL